MEADRFSQDRSSILDRSSNLDSDDPLRVFAGASTTEDVRLGPFEIKQIM